MSLYVFPMKISSLHWNSAAYTCKEKLWRKVVVSIKCCNLHSFKERVILLCQSILEMRQIPHSYGPALFTIPLKICLTFSNLKLQHINSSLTYKKINFTQFITYHCLKRDFSNTKIKNYKNLHLPEQLFHKLHMLQPVAKF